MEKIRKSSVKQCIAIILISILGLVTFVIPFTVNPVEFSFSKFFTSSEGNNFFNNYLVEKLVEVSKIGIPKVISSTSSYTNIIEYAYKYVTFCYAGIIILNVLFAILVIITKANVLRKIFRVFSIIFGVLLFISALLFIFHLVGVYGYSVNNELKINEIFNDTAVLFDLGMIIFSIIIGLKQFSWFKNKKAN